MEIYATTKFIIIITVIIIMIVIYIYFKLQELPTMNPSRWHPPHVDNTNTLYLEDQHCFVRNSFNLCFSFHLCLSVNSVYALMAQLYTQDKVSLGLKPTINCSFKLFRNLLKNWERDNGLRFQFELAFSPIISTGVLSF